MTEFKRGWLGGALIGVATIVTLIGAGGAYAAHGDLTYADCITADSNIAAGTNDCTPTTATGIAGADTGLHQIKTATASPDGRSLYAVTESDSSVLTFDVSPAGVVTLAGCFTADSDVVPGTNGCTAADTTAPGGTDTGFDFLVGLAVSPDGRSLYASSNTDGSIVRFDRAADGVLTYRDCFAADSNIAAGTNNCTLAATTGSNGINTGFDSIRQALVVSPDGSALYGASDDDSAIVHFSRAADGALTYKGCLTADSNIAAGTNDCAQTASTSANGPNTGLDDLFGLVIAPDGSKLFAPSEDDSALLGFDLAADGTPSLSSCLTADSDVPAGTNGCAHTATTAAAGTNTGLDDLEDLVITPDGSSLYAASVSDAGIVGFNRSGGGAPTLANCLTADSDTPAGTNGCVHTAATGSGGANTGFDDFRDGLLIDAEGGTVYAGANDDAAVLTLARGTGGALTLRGCFTADSDIPVGTNGCAFAATTGAQGGNTGLGGISGLAFAGPSLVASAKADASIARFTREDTIGPETSLDSGPSGASRETTANFEFSSPTLDTAGFSCQLDGADFGDCPAAEASTSRTLTAASGYSDLAHGEHTFEVAAVDFAGNPDPSPASAAFTVDIKVTGAKLKANKKQKQERRKGKVKKVKVKAKAGAGEKVALVGKGKLIIKGKKKLKLKKVTKNTKAGKKKKLVFKSKKKQHARKVNKALKRGEKVKAKLTVKYTDELGNTKTKKKKVRLR